MAGTVEKFRKRAVFVTSVSIKNKNGSGGFRSLQGFLNNSNGGTMTTGIAAGTMVMTLNGTSVAGTQALLDLTAHRLRIPSAGREIGGNTVGFGTNCGAGNGSAGDIVTGFVAGSAQLGININGTMYVLQWPTNPSGAAGSVSVNSFAAGVA